MADYNKILNGVSGAAGMLTSAVQAGVRMGELPETEEQQEEIDDLYTRYSQSSSMSDLQNLFDSTRLAKTNYDYTDLLGMSSGEAAGNIALETVSQGAQGAQTGASIGGGWGALIGGILGTVGGAFSSGFGWLARKNKAKKEAERLNKEGIRANDVFMANFNNSVENAMTNKRNQSLLNLAAFGGPLDTTFTNGVRFITEGGSHESNPYSGVLQGIAQDGLPNLVEEGEVIYDDYVYSRRLKVPQADKESLGLKKDKEYTYAEAATQIQKESEERPNDPISKRNLEEMMGRLQGSQETLKEKRDGQALKRAINNMTPDELAMFMQQLQQPQQMQPMMAMQGMQPMQPTQSEVPMFGKGGLLSHKHAGPFSLSFLNTPTSFNFTPVTEQDVLDLYEDTYGFKPGFKVAEEADLAERIGKVRKAANLPQDRYVPKTTTSSETNSEKNSNFSFAQALRTAPVWGSLASSIASLFDKPNYSNIARAERAARSVPRVSATSIGQRMAYNPIDINYIATQQANNALGARRALAEYGAGNPTGVQQAVIANNYANQTALGQAIMQANQLNRQNLAQVLEFNRQTDSANAANNLQAALANQQRDMTVADFLFRTGQLRDAELARIQANRSANLTNLFNNLGNLGTDMLNRDMARAMAESYGVTYNPYMQALFSQYRAKGGKLNTKKGGKDA